MLSIFVVRPGCTEFDAQGRMKGSLDIPMNEEGQIQAAQTAGELANTAIEMIYHAPCQSATQTASALAETTGCKVKVLSGLVNLDHGLWHGKRIEEVKRSQPKVYRHWREHPEAVCPPEGESMAAARERAGKALRKIVRKHKDGVVAIVASEPLASVLISILKKTDLGSIWKSACDQGNWDSVEVEPERVLATK